MMQPTTQNQQFRQTAQDAETRLWSRYMLAEINENRVGCQYDKAWREYVMSGPGDDCAAEKWRTSLARWQEAGEKATAARKAWQRVAYPLYGWPLPDEDVSSS
jgi:hypothetical protein